MRMPYLLLQKKRDAFLYSQTEGDGGQGLPTKSCKEDPNSLQEVPELTEEIIDHLKKDTSPLLLSGKGSSISINTWKAGLQ